MTEVGLSRQEGDPDQYPTGGAFLPLLNIPLPIVLPLEGLSSNLTPEELGWQQQQIDVHTPRKIRHWGRILSAANSKSEEDVAVTDSILIPDTAAAIKLSLKLQRPVCTRNRRGRLLGHH